MIYISNALTVMTLAIKGVNACYHGDDEKAWCSDTHMPFLTHTYPLPAPFGEKEMVLHHSIRLSDYIIISFELSVVM